MVDLIEEIKKFFFRAMSQGWVTGAEEIEIPELPGYKVIIFEENEFCLVDAYCVNGKKSFGFTTIFVNDQPVWTMSYGGFYEEEAIPLLKRALKEAYESHEFVGGRGPRSVTEGHLVYTNHVEKNDFRSFKGREEILDLQGKRFLGYHEYWGMSLI